MNEINNPERQIDKPSAERSPENMRSAEASRGRMKDDLDSGFKPDNKEGSEAKSIRSDTPEKRTEATEMPLKNKLDNMGSDGKASDQGMTNKETDKVEQEKSKFSSDNFKAENSYDARATKETRELAAKAHSELVPMGGDTSVQREAKEPYTAQEAATLKAERDRIDAPTQETVMQKVIGVDNGNLEKDLKDYLNPTDRFTGNPKDADVYGFVSKAEDAAPYTGTPKECHDNLRLDYNETNYRDPNQSVYVLRFTDGTNYEVPYNETFGGNSKDAQPCTGNGYLGGDKYLIPEYKVVKDSDNRGAVITDGEIYRVNPDGSEELVASYNKQDRCFELEKKKVEA